MATAQNGGQAAQADDGAIHVVIIGGGIIGCSTAHYLRKLHSK